MMENFSMEKEMEKGKNLMKVYLYMKGNFQKEKKAKIKDKRLKN